MRRQRVIALLLAALAISLLVAAWGLLVWRDTNAALAEAAVVLRRAQVELQATPQDPGRRVAARTQLTAGRTALARAWRGAAPVLVTLDVVGRLPGPMRTLAAPPALLRAALLACDAGLDLLDGAEPLLAAFAQTNVAAQDPVSLVISSLRAGQPAFARAQRWVDEAAGERRRFAGATLPEPLARADDELASALETLRGAAATAQAAPELLMRVLGFDHPRSYLILMQNEDERRATGGFVGTIGVITLEQGRLAQSEFRSSYDWDNPGRAYVQPPEPLQRYMGLEAWYLRDANWYPDFPSSAAVAEWLWQRDQSQAVDGVLAMDESFLRLLLQALGPVRLPSLGETINADNVKERGLFWIYEAVRRTGQTELVRQTKTPFVSALGEALFARVQSAGVRDLPALLGALDAGLTQKHLLLAFDDPLLRELAAARAWDGRVATADGGDALLVVDSTTSYSKMAPFVEQSLDYQVALAAEGPARARLTLRYAHRYRPGDAALFPRPYLGEYWDAERRGLAYQEGYYASYVRVYAPIGSRALRVTGATLAGEPYQESGRTVFPVHLALLPGEERTVQIEYALRLRLTETPAGPRYNLILQSQPGAAWPFRVLVAAPDGWAVRQVDAGGSVVEGLAAWQGRLDRDMRLTVTLAR